ncbi:histidine phosphatase family protein [Pseudomonas gingeri]|uniref:Histidine phosphatase family protein n=1 Tax=Pseudomonas gingeri TaxID=117681 RepID=A0A7Y8CN62_9PSED|nr:histidine phosphatase family protein [Pseudomonas gingeri]NWA17305.1 histidine phosphatase family protein [Pseudomonas gingeri]NWA56327.1 histidine phosphatase family protein [Pseudomonas gingeri]NWA98111.1 histidine phosphatase family protein [Pseudomonas gingeri]NWB02521.1 histidine phosphatase family protein [Pseudomonas gingeri]
MESRLTYSGIRRSFELSRFAKYKNTLVVLLCALFVIPLTLFILRPATITDLARHGASSAVALSTGWAKGEMVVLVRHVERCDRSKAPCLAGQDGITDRARDVAVGLGARFEKLGLARTDIYNSPLTRAVQTSFYMFNQASSTQDWLFDCRKTMLRDLRRYKVPGRNLILVTHSECMNALEKSMKLSIPSMGYGAALFITENSPSQAPRVMGFIEASDWPQVFQP